MARTITFADWKRKLRDEIWPSGYPENLLNALDSAFVAGCMDMQRAIECLQENNASIYPNCSTYFNCGLTWVDAPAQRALIKRVWTVANGDYSNKVFYHQREHIELAEWQQNLLQYTVPLNTGMPRLPLGDRFTEKSTDSKLGRSRRGIWSLQRRRIYIAPWIQSNETIIIEWDGVKTKWEDADLIDLDVWDTLYEEALKLFVKWSYERDFGSEVTIARQAKVDYDDKLALLINDCHQALRVRNEEGAPQSYAASSAQLLAEKIPAEDTVPALAIIGGYGSGDINAKAVADMVKAWSPLAIITTGGNNGGDITDLAEWDRCVGAYYQQYIFPYVGSYGVGAESNQFWPALDAMEVSSISKYAEYFQSVGAKMFYDTVVGNVHFFFITGTAAVGSEQGIWLQGALALSTVRWKVVVVNTPPFTSGNALASSATLQWPFEDWGANLVISGREEHYERLADASAFPYIVLGSGGLPLNGFGSPLASSVVRQGSLFAALKLSASCTDLKLSCIATDGTLIDSITIK